MITRSSIDKIKDIAIQDVVSLHVSLKKAGSGYTGCCPFHDEKTPSFHVTPAKGFYKCFGCGASGDGIKFIQEVEQKTFYEALERLSSEFHIELEHEDDGRTKEQRKQETDQKAEAFKMLQNAQQRFFKQRTTDKHSAEVEQYLTHKRQFTADTIQQWGIGFGSADSKFLTAPITAAKKEELATAIGLLRQKDGRYYDAYFNRITFPICNHIGQIVGFGGRKLPSDTDSKSPKYINSSESHIYHKSEVLFGLDKSIREIQKQDFAILVEGYTDVISMHQNGFAYTVATCGTALTIAQIKLLSRFTKNLLILRDGDKAGRKATLRDIEYANMCEFNVWYAALPEGEDPDSFSRKPEFVSWLGANIREGIELELQLAAERNEFSPEEKLDALARVIGRIKRDTKRELWIEKTIKEYKLNAKVFKLAVKKFISGIEDEPEEVRDLSEKEINQKLAHLKWLTKEKKEEAFFTDGFTICEEPHGYGYWFGTAGFNIEQLTNFTIKPLFSVNEPTEKFELIEVTNKYSSTILEAPQGTFTSMNSFEKLMWEARATVLNNFNQQHLRKLNAKNIFIFKEATLVRTLGMQPEGFWSYADAVYKDGKIESYDKTGIVTVNKETYYSPGAAEHNRNKRKDEFGREVTDGDPYRNDKFLSYQKSPITFEQWAQQMHLVFGPKAMNAVAQVILCINKDIITSFEKLPLLYGYGDAESGKSAWAERIFYFFFAKDSKPFNLNSGTIFTFFNTLERFKNCPFLFNEFDEDNINEEFFRAFKQAHDGEGRNKGMMGTSVKNKSTEQPINIAPILIGQILSTKDGGSVLSRCVPEKFIGRTYTDAEKAEFDKLLSWEKQGLNGIITELLKYRAEFRKDFFQTFNLILGRMKREITEEGAVYKERIARNHCIMLAGVQLMIRHFKLGFDFETYYTYMLGSVISLTEMVNDSNNLGVFWKELMFMYEQQMIEQDWDYKIVVVDEIKVMVSKEGRKVEITKKFEQPTKLLMLRLTSIFPMFETRVKMSTGTKAINSKTLITYFEGNKGYVGNSQSSHFHSEKKKMNSKTSSFVFLYDELDLQLDRNVNGGDELLQETHSGKIMRTPEYLKVGEENMVKFILATYISEGMPRVTTQINYICFVPQALDLGVAENDAVTVTGYVSESGGFKPMNGKRTWFNMDVTAIKKGNAADKESEEATEPQKNLDLPF